MEHTITNETVVRAHQDDDAPIRQVNPEFDLERAAHNVMEANRDLRQLLDSYDAVIQKNLDDYRAGTPIREVIEAMPPGDVTIGSEVVVIEVFEARRAFRKALVFALLADGMQVDEVASTFNVSIESICDLANELGKPRD